jgi:hypothetical protein
MAFLSPSPIFSRHGLPTGRPWIKRDYRRTRSWRPYCESLQLHHNGEFFRRPKTWRDDASFIGLRRQADRHAIDRSIRLRRDRPRRSSGRQQEAASRWPTGHRARSTGRGGSGHPLATSSPTSAGRVCLSAELLNFERRPLNKWELSEGEIELHFNIQFSITTRSLACVGKLF